MKGAGVVLRPSDLGAEFYAIIVAHSRECELAMFAAAHRGAREVPLEILNTPKVMRRTRGPSAGQPMPAPVDQGELFRSTEVRRTKDGATLDVTAPHAAHMEHGTKPHAPPKAPIEAWARRKARGMKAPKKAKKPKKQGKSRKKTSTVSKRKPMSAAAKKAGAVKRAAARAAFQQKAAENLAKAAILGITKYGTEGREFYKRASAKFGKFAVEELRKRLGKIK